MKLMFCKFVFHAIAIGIIATLLGLFLLPASRWAAVFQVGLHADVTVISALNLAIHLITSAMIWIAIQRAIALLERPKISVKRATGSVMTETLVIMPLFLLLAFGMGQLALNNVAAILGNVAVYQAARTAWIWMPEEQVDQKRQGIEEGTAVEKARVAAAMVMLPAAPGDYFFGELEGENTAFAEKARLVAAASHVPGGGLITDAVGDDINQIADFFSQGTAGAFSNPLDYLSFSTALDQSNFITRTLKKFSLAYNSTTIEIDEETHEVTMTYLHFQGMPYVGRVFGEKMYFDGPTFRPGYYAKIERTYGFLKQANLPNASTPDNELPFEPELPVSAEYYGGVSE